MVPKGVALVSAGCVLEPGTRAQAKHENSSTKRWHLARSSSLRRLHEARAEGAPAEARANIPAAVHRRSFILQQHVQLVSLAAANFSHREIRTWSCGHTQSSRSTQMRRSFVYQRAERDVSKKLSTNDENVDCGGDNAGWTAGDGYLCR